VAQCGADRLEELCWIEETGEARGHAANSMIAPLNR